MQLFLFILLFGPFVVAALYTLLPIKIRKLILLGFVTVFGLSSLMVHSNIEEFGHISLSVDSIIIAIDYLLLLYFLYVGVTSKHLAVLLLSSVQIILFSYFIFGFDIAHNPQIYVDSLSSMMLILINIIGGAIIVYAFDYMKDETKIDAKRGKFISLLVAFLGVMNFAVVSDNIEWFFLFFELTTLFSFLLISFREDEISIQNGLRALWMNQIGGVLILGALLYLAAKGLDIRFSAFNSENGLFLVLPIALLSLGAMIKGAMFPFDKWLLGAMVAPTPVSAILHSATMVKIAPYLILRLSEALAASGVGIFITFFGSIVFFGAGFVALGRDNLKEILAYSTIAMLALAIALGATGDSTAQFAALVIIIFHGISKALLFMAAGIFEKRHHAKTLSQIKELLFESPFLVLATTIGFLSITIPPLGAFLGKMFALQAFSQLGLFGVITLISLVFIIFGSVALAVLYFRAIGSMVQKEGAKMGYAQDLLSPWYKYSVGFLLFLVIFVSMGCFFTFPYLFVDPLIAFSKTEFFFDANFYSITFGEIELKMYYLLAALIFMLSPLFALMVRIEDIDKVREYSCGERFSITHNMFSISLFDRNKKYLDYVGIVSFVFIILWSL